MTRLPRLARRACTLGLVLAPLLAAPACSDEAQFTTRFASDFAPAGHKVAVLGVFKDGRMNAEAWETVGPKLCAPFGATCDTAYGGLVTGNQALASAVDDYVRANGPGDELLDVLAPAAGGDLVVVFTLAGHVAAKPVGSADPGFMTQGSASSPSMGTGKYRGMRPQGGYGSRGMKGPAAGPAALEVSASFFSVSQHKAVGMVAMNYDGQSFDEAMQRFAAKLAAALPGTTCATWDWKAKVDEARVRELAGQ